jgi:hypothetical protein
MATLLRIDNFPQTNIKEQSQLNVDMNLAATTATLQSANGFSIGDSVYLGIPGSENIEKLIVQSIAGQVITFASASVFKHLQYETVVAVKGDQIKIYTSANVDGSLPADTAFALLGTPIAIDPDESYTEYNDTTGSALTWYKNTFYNASSGYESTLADSIGTRGGGYGHYTAIDDVRREAGFTRNLNVTDSMIDVQRNRAEAQINAELYLVYTLPFAQPIPWVINNIATKLAAGFLLTAEYGSMARGLSKDGDLKIKEAEDLLMAVKMRELTLTGANGQSLVISQAISSYPNNASDSVAAPQAFSRSHKF